MAGENVCKYNKHGYCKFQSKCDRKHIDKLCEETSCDVDKCKFRHPKSCNYYKEYGRCKFGEWCSYKHDENSMKLMESKHVELIRKMDLLEEKMNDKEQIIEEMVKKLDLFVHKNEIVHLKEMILEKDSFIENLQEQLDDLKKVIDAKYDNNEESQSSENHEITFFNPSVSIPCEECNFIAKNEKGLKIHRKSKHENNRKQFTNVELNIFALATEEYFNYNIDA